jgi:ornithine--oxo-acid transaminase
MQQLSENLSYTQELIDLENEFGVHNYHPLDVVIERAEGVWVYDVEGRRYLDCLAAYSAVNQGHCHPKILRALMDQAGKITLTSRAFHNEQLPHYLKELNDLTGFEMAMPLNSGTEAVEAAIKIARKWGHKIKGIPEGKAEIIVCDGNFHGRTIAIVSFSSSPEYRDGFGPFPAGFKSIPYGDVEALRAAITPNTCAFLVEPIQGEGGIIIPPDGYLHAAAEICKQNNVLLVLDEIQSGLGRTGKLFCYEHENIVPDVLILGKALAGGFMPVSAVLASREILGVIQPGDHGSTFGGNPLACAVARAALRVLIDEKMIDRAAELGDYFLDRIRAIQSRDKRKIIKEIRGKGLWIAIELHGMARPYCEALKEEGILAKETHDHIIRIAPPLTITRDEIDWAVERLTKVLDA